MPVTTQLPRVVDFRSETCCLYELWKLSSLQDPVGIAWTADNLALAVPYMVPGTVTIVGLGFRTGGAAPATNVDLGIYNSAFVRQASLGSTALLGANRLQRGTVNVTLTRGIYYVAMSIQTAAGTSIYGTNLNGLSVRELRAFGMVQMAAAFPLPATLVPTPAIASGNIIPDVFMTQDATWPGPNNAAV